MGFKKKKILLGLSSVCSCLCALMFGAEIIAGSGDYKDMVNGVLGGVSVAAGTADTYAFTSDYENTTEMLTERVRIAEQIGEEGCVLLKNKTHSLPLRDSAADARELKVTMLGSRAYTYKADGVTLRDTSMTFYGGITGSKIIEEKVTTADGTFRVPVTMEKALQSENIRLNPALFNFYSNKAFPSLLGGSEGSGNEGSPYAVNESYLDKSDCGDYEEYADACLVVIGRCSGEGRDYFPGIAGVDISKNDGSTCAIGLSDNERNLIAVANQISDNVIVLINSAISMEIDELKEDERVDSVMWIGLPGAYGLNGVARVLSGKTSPSGRLPDTYAVNASNSPAAQNFGVYTQDGGRRYTWSDSPRTDSDDSHYVVMAEDIYTGYAYYETRYADCVEEHGNASSAKGAVAGASAWKYEDEVSYPFGFGMSYSRFTQEIVPDSFVYNSSAKTISVDVKVTNTGDKAAKDTAQLYVQVPYTEYDKKKGVEKSAVQLLAIGKTDTLYPQSEADESVGAYNSQTLTLTADMKYFASYDKTISHDGVTGGYILEEGDYYFSIGNGAHEALNNILLKKGIEPSALYWEEGSAANELGAVKWTTEGLADFSFNVDGVDSSYFSKTENGTVVKNQMEDADYNYFNAGTITYLSRSDWERTFPVSYPGLKETAAMKDYLDSNVYKFTTSGSTDVEFGIDHEEDLDENGTPLQNKSVAEYKLKSYDDPDWDYLLEQITFDEAWKFSPYGGSSCNPFASVNAPTVWQIDGPNGNVTRSYGALAPDSGYLAVPSSDPNADYFSCDMPCAPMTAATFNADLVEKQGEIYGEDNLWSRNPIMWAPGMNLHRTPFNSRNHEYYSEDAMLTNILGVSFVRGGLSKGSILAAKHFAFNSQESYREGLCQFMEEQSAREKELRAFQGLSEDVVYINSAGNAINALGLMSSFSRVGVCGVNAHTGLMKNILRGEWGFNGLISTDMVVAGNFFNPQDSVINNVTFMATSNAENLLSSYWQDYNNKKKVQSDPNMVNALYENMHYYMYSIANSIALNGIAPGDTIQTDVMSYWEYILLIGGGVFGAGALTLLGVVAYRDSVTRKKARATENGGERHD